ncbi:MAG: hypothetical protein R6U98_22600 [Pirellulaceae bacterium]
MTQSIAYRTDVRDATDRSVNLKVKDRRQVVRHHYRIGLQAHLLAGGRRLGHEDTTGVARPIHVACDHRDDVCGRAVRKPSA